MHVLEIHRSLTLLPFDKSALKFDIAGEQGTDQVLRDELQVH